MALGTARIAEGSPATIAICEPRSTAPYALLTVCRTGRVSLIAALVIVLIVPILAPLKHIAVHVIESPGVRRVTAHLGGASQGRSLDSAAVRIIASEIRLLRGQRISAMERCLRTGT